MRRYVLVCALVTMGWNALGTQTALATDPPGSVADFVKELLAPGSTTDVPSPPVDVSATHTLTRTVKIGMVDGVSPQSVILLPSGHIACLLTRDRYAAVGAEQNAELTGAMVVVLDPSGDELARFKTNFIAESIAPSTDGDILLAGSGRLACYRSSGEEISNVEIPFVMARLGDEEALTAGAIAQIDERNKIYQNMIDRFDEQIAQRKEALEKAEATWGEAQAALKSLSEGEGEIPENSTRELEIRKAELNVARCERKVTMAKQSQASVENNIQIYRDNVKEKTPEVIAATIESIKSNLTKVHCISQRGSDLFLILSEDKGYGYGLWKTDATLASGTKCIAGLRGCCGQYHLQACEDGLYCAENTNYRVARYDEQGEVLASFGKKGRDDDGGFTGCCNPMNVFVSPSGALYCSESNGNVKRYAPDGQLQAQLVKHAGLNGGCRNMSFAVNEDLKRVYICDLTNKSVLIFDETPESPVAQN